MRDKRLILHDVGEADFAQVAADLPEDMLVFAARPEVRPCVGCFGCWIKTPGQCVIADRAQVVPGLLARSREVVIISRSVYGGHSPEIKAAMDRSIGYILPYFRVYRGEMHHRMRYEGTFALTVHFYGGGITQAQRETAGALVAANETNFGASGSRVFFHENAREAIKEAVV